LIGLNYTDKVEKDEMGRECSMNGGEEECISNIGGEARRTETTKKPIHRWVDIKMDPGEIIWDDMD
jgi:hypothetical protein